MFSYKEACQSSSNAVILPSISDENIDHMLNLFSSRMDEIMQEITMELKASTQSPEDTNHTETEQAQAGYEEIRETPAIPDLPRIMPGYQDSFVNEGCCSKDRENFLCPTSGQQSNEDCLLTDCNIQLEEKFTTLPLTSVTSIPQNCSFSRIEGASHIGLINPKHSNHASLDVPADMTQTNVACLGQGRQTLWDSHLRLIL